MTDRQAQTIRFDRELIKKYDRPGPRYTSYPTAPQFRDDFGSADYAELLLESRGEGDAAALPLSIYLHVPFCETRCFFCGCNVIVSRDKERRAREYLPLLEREMDAVAELAGAASREAIQVHWGGGTPTFLPPADVARLMAAVRRRFRLSADCEIGVEVDPRRLSEAHLDALAEAGVNRLSMGVQDIEPAVQRAVNRIQPVDETWAVLEGARRRGMTSVNIDLIYGLPHQTPATFAATVDEVVRMSPDRIALFNFAYLPELFAHQRTIDPAALPDPEAKLSILEDSIARLTGAGYVFIGMDHFARPEDPLAKALADRTLTRNFQGYSTCGRTDLLAFGVSSISHVAGGFAQNVKEIPAYERALDEGRLPVYRGLVASPEDRLRRDVILGIMGHFHLDKDEIEAAHGIDFDRHFASALAALEPLAADGLLEIGERSLDLTPLGRLLVRNVAMAFDGYLASRSEVRYSRTV
jgi:oxygen-independent coproporphyrinogen-3 oxidase